jgi:hypothetical protein
MNFGEKLTAKEEMTSVEKCSININFAKLFLRKDG